jgi:hypothetical protein
MPKKANSRGSQKSLLSQALTKKGQTHTDREKNMRPKKGQEHSRRHKGQPNW